VRKRYLPSSRLTGEANILVMPNIDAANILFNVLKIVGGHGVTVGRSCSARRARSHPHALGDGAPHRQHDRARGRQRGPGHRGERGDAIGGLKRQRDRYSVFSGRCL
jgi:hypothetical protein